MKKVERSIRSVSIAELHEKHLLNGFLHSDLESTENVQKQERLLQAILQNNPLPTLVVGEYINTSSGNRKYLILQGKQMVSLILSCIKRKQKPGGLLGEMDGLTGKDMGQFWNYTFAAQFVLLDISPEEAEKTEAFVDFRWITEQGVNA